MSAPSIRAMKDGDTFATLFPFTTEGLQAAIDFGSGGKVKVFIGPGTLETTTVISLHSGCHLQGSGIGVTLLKRASGTVGGSDAAYSANMLISTAYGSNGTLSGSSSAQTDITVSDITLDGNYTAFTSVVFSDLATGHYGIKFQYVDGVVIRNVETKNFLQTGCDLVSCANARVSDVKYSLCGQYATAASRNSFNYNNGTAGAIAAGYARGLTLCNMESEGPSDVHITLKNVNDCAISNCVFKGALIGVELESTAAVGSVFKNYTFSNIDATDITGNFIRVSPSASTAFENVVFRGGVCEFHATDHGNDTATIQSGAIFLGRTNDAYIKGFKITDFVFRNINTNSTNTEMSMVLIGLPGTTSSSDIEISRCSFYGANGSENNTANKGMHIYGNIANGRFEDLYFSGVEGIGVHVQSGTTTTVIDDLRFRNVIIDGCQEDGFKCLVDQAGASITKVEFSNCVAKNPAIAATSYRCFFIGASAAGTCTDIAVRHSRGYRTSSVCNGVEVFQSAGTVDSISLDTNDFSDLGSGHSVGIATGTLTNVWFDDLPMKGNAIASAASVTAGRGNFFGVSGTTTVDTITPHTVFDARPVTFLAGSTANFGDGTGNLRLAGTWAPTANDTITLRYDRSVSVWYEVCRSGDI